MFVEKEEEEPATTVLALVTISSLNVTEASKNKARAVDD